MGNDRENEREVIRIQMFGRFAMSGMNACLDEDGIRSGMLTKLMAYLLCNRFKEISSQELIDALWQESDSENPAGALKNLVYRLRTILKKSWDSYDFVLTGRGTYRLNDKVPFVLDTEEFEKCCKAAAHTQDPEEKVRLYTEAVSFYSGTFLPNITGEYWTVSLATYYHSMFLTAVKELAHLLECSGQYEKMNHVCSQALKLEPLDEDLYCLSVQSLIWQNKLNLAREQYRKAVDTLYENLGITPSRNLRKVYDELLKQTHEEEMSLQAIKEEMEEEAGEGAFFCEYGVFRKLYQLEKRRAERLGISEYLALVTVLPVQEMKVDSQTYLALIVEAMQQLEQILGSSLRAGDVITKYSGSQYMILLPTCQYETAKMVIRRIEESFYSVSRRKVKLHFGLDEMGFAEACK